MKPRLSVLGLAVLALALPGATRAAEPKDVKDPATLLPGHTLVYGELWQPGRLIQEINGLLKGSALEDTPAAVARFRQKAGLKDDQRLSALGVAGAGLLLSPEVLAEFGRIQGMAGAMTGLSKEGEPVGVFVVLPGDSLWFGLITRTLLSVSDDIRSVGEVEGVHLFRSKGFVPGIPGPGAPPPPGLKSPPGPKPPSGKGPGGPHKDEGVVIAMTPGLIVYGSTPEVVKDVVLRYKGKGKGGSLADQPGFKAAARLRQGGGLFGYTDIKGLIPRIDDLSKKAESREDRKSAEKWRATSEALNLKAFRSLAWSLMLRNGNVESRTSVTFDPKESNPLVELLPDRKADPKLLHAVPRESLTAWVAATSGGGKRWESLLKLADTLAKLNDEKGPLPSEHVAEVEKKIGLSIGKDLLGKINGVAAGLTAAPGGKKDQKGDGVVVIEATDPEAAGSLEGLIPKLAALAAMKEKGEPTPEEVGGQKLHKLALEEMPAPLYYGRRGKLLVMGTDGKQVAAGLTGAAKKGGLLGEPKVSAAIADLDGPLAIGVWMLGRTVAYGVKELGGGPPTWKSPAKDGGKAAKGADGKFDKEMTKLAGELPPILMSVVRKPDSLTLDIRQPDLKAVSARMIDLLVERALEEASKPPMSKPGPGVKPGAEPKKGP